MLKRKLIVAALSLLTLAFSMQPIALAQARGSGLSISPTLTQLTLNPGESKTLTYQIRNATIGSINAVPSVEDFAADGTTGNPKLLTGPGQSSPYSIKNFVYQLDQVPLDPGVQKNISVGLHIPDGTAPGAYYGVITYKAVPTTGSASAPGQVSLTASVGSIVLITVPGKIYQQVQFSAIHIYRGSNDATLFFTKPDKIGIEIRNLGNGFVQPFGSVEVQDMFNKSVDTFQFNNPKQLGNILPKSTRIFTNSFTGVGGAGRYKVTASVSYGTGGDVLIMQKTFWYIPAWLAIIILLVVAVLLFLAYKAFTHHRRHGKSFRRRS